MCILYIFGAMYLYTSHDIRPFMYCKSLYPTSRELNIKYNNSYQIYKTAIRLSKDYCKDDGFRNN